MPSISPLATAWAQLKSAEILKAGEALTTAEADIARRVGVIHPERIRVLMVNQIYLSTDPKLAQTATATGLIGPNIIGLTLGYGIYIRHGHRSTRLVSHECRHVFQFEKAGSIEQFIDSYLQEVAEFGYAAAPMELDAQAHEVNG